MIIITLFPQPLPPYRHGAERPGREAAASQGHHQGPDHAEAGEELRHLRHRHHLRHAVGLQVSKGSRMGMSLRFYLYE